VAAQGWVRVSAAVGLSWAAAHQDQAAAAAASSVADAGSDPERSWFPFLRLGLSESTFGERVPHPRVLAWWRLSGHHTISRTCAAAAFAERHRRPVIDVHRGP
jgi:hypothetical protein